MVWESQSMGGAAKDHHTPLLQYSDASSVPLPVHTVKRTGNVWTAVSHIITAVIGSGVLSLAWSLAQLGWIAGPLSMVIFASITLGSSFLLADCYRSPDPTSGPTRNRSYIEAVHLNLGNRSAWLCGLFIQINLYGTGIAYIITSGTSMRAIQEANCYHKYGHNAACEFGDTYYMLLFGALQIVMSQIPNFHDIDWLSAVAAAMSFAYSFIGVALGVAKVIGNGVVKGSIGGIKTSTTPQKILLVAQALGDVAFAYPYAMILIEIQDTLKSPPAENKTMKKAATIATGITTFFFLCCGGFGYAAFGDSTPGNLLTGFGFYEPYWLVDFANACIVLHLVGGYQLYSQPLFAAVDRWLAEKLPGSEFVNSEYNLKVPLLPAFRLNLLRLCFRTAYVASTIGIAVIFPYFNQVLGVLGALIFWPLTVYFPVELHLAQSSTEAWTTKWVLLRAYSFGCLSVTTFAFVGSLEGLLTARLS